MQIKGILVPIGGNEDKGMGKAETYTLDFIQKGILSHLVREAGSNEAPIVIIPTASSIPVEVGKNYVHAFSRLGCKNIRVLDIRKKDEAGRPDYLEAMEQAGIILFSGGDQSRITRIIGKSPLFDLLHRRYREEKVVIAGTSAGAMAMSSVMIAGGKSTEAMYKGGVKLKQGLKLLPELIIDSHFIQRGRFNRVVEALAHHPDRMGIGLAEDTGLVIRNGTDAKVIGSGMVLCFDPSHLLHNNVKHLEEGTPMTLTNLTVHIVANGDQINLKERTVSVLPIHAPFE